MQTTTLSLTVRLDVPFETARELIIDALREEGFGILTEIDVQETMKKKVGAAMPHYSILGACNPALAYAAIQLDSDVGLLLPCNVVVREETPDASVVSIMDPSVMSRLIPAEGLAQIASLARDKLERALRAVTDQWIE